MTINTLITRRTTMLTWLAVSLLGGSTQVTAWTVVAQPLGTAAAPKIDQAVASKPELVSAVLGFAGSVRAGPPRRTLLSAGREAIVKVLTEAKFTALQGNYGPDADAEAFYSEAMNCTVLLSRSGALWLTAQRGQPSVELHYQAMLDDHS